MAMQTWPELRKAPWKMPGAAFLGSASSSTIPASLPPNSRVMRLMVSAALLITFFPVADDPVKEILRTSGCFVSSPPRSLASVITFNTPGGNASLISSAKRKVASGVVGAGGKTKGLAGRISQRFAVLLGQEPGQLIGIGLNDHRDGLQCLLPFRQRGCAPSGKSGLGGGNGFFQLRLGRARRDGQNPLGRRIDHVHLRVAVFQTAVDQKLERLHRRTSGRICLCKNSPPRRNI